MNVAIEEVLRTYAAAMIGIPYKFGGKNPIEGLDCSGLVQLLLRSAGVLKGSFLSAAAMRDVLIASGAQPCSPCFGAVAFFADARGHIDHVGFCLNEHFMVEARGGAETTLTREDAAAKGAFVEPRLISHRDKLVAALMPAYPNLDHS